MKRRGFLVTMLALPVVPRDLARAAAPGLASGIAMQAMVEAQDAEFAMQDFATIMEAIEKLLAEMRETHARMAVPRWWVEGP